MEKEYYVYAWFIKSTGKIFHIGKGKNNRCNDIIHSRNDYFKNTINAHPDDVEVKKLYENLTNEEACALERTLIEEYKSRGECETNLHEGGCGGNTGNYHSVERHNKLSKFAAKRVGELNPNFGNTWSVEQRAKQSEKLKKAWIENRDKFMQNRNHVAWNKGLVGAQVAWNKGEKLSDSHYLHMMQADCKFKYEVYYENQLVYWCLGHSRLIKYCEDTFNISRTIIAQIIDHTWKPKFKKHNYLISLTINKIDRSVSTNRDECNDVEWRLLPFEVHGNQ